MQRQTSIGGRIIVVGFLIVWIAMAISMGFFFIDFANSWPEWGPGPHPSLFVWIPFAFAGFGILLLLVNIVSWVRKPSRQDYTQGYSTMTTLTDDAQSVSAQTSGFREPTASYEIQPYCSQCGSKMDSELIEWVGPLNYRCPSCGYIHKA